MSQHGLLAVMFSWVAILLGLVFVLGYRHCQNNEERVLECVKVGRSPVECRAALDSTTVAPR